MKKLLLASLTLICASVLVVQAQDTAAPKKAKAKLTPEQKQLQAEIKAKYDTNKDGKLDKAERAAMSQEDKDKLAKAGLGPKKKGAAEAPKADAPKTDAAK